MTKDMITGKPGRSLFLFALPMVLGNLFQQLYNIVDSIVVGQFVGTDALAAVGASSSITFLFIAVATGMSIGASVVISQYFGAGLLKKMKSAIYTIILSMLILSIVLTIVGVLGNETLLKYMNSPQNIRADAAIFLHIYLCGLPFLFLYNILTAIFNALGDSKTPLVLLIFSSFVNIGLDFLFVPYFHWGVAGVAIATFIAQAISAILCYFCLVQKLKTLEIPKGDASFFDFSVLRTIFRIAVPSTMQQSIVSIGLLLVQALVNQYGSDVVAGYVAATKIDLIAIMPMVNVGSAMSTFVAQNLGAGKPERIKRGYHAALMINVGIALTVSVILLLFGRSLVGVFLNKNSSPKVIQIGVEYLKVVGITYIIMGTMNVTNAILRGAGDIKYFLAGALANLGIRVGLAYGLSALIGEKAIWYSIPVGWLIGLCVAYLRYRSNKWQDKILV